jgi:hypothetical protein
MDTTTYQMIQPQLQISVTNGLYYKHIAIVNGISRVVNE